MPTATDMQIPETPFFSQFGEDARLAKIFRDKPIGTCVEVGALDGMKDSTTLHFEKKGWNCILVEANPDLAKRARANGRASVFACAAGELPGNAEFLIAKGAEYLSTIDLSESSLSRLRVANADIERVMVPVMRLDDILHAAKVDALDFATIDVEGAEFNVLKAFDLERWKPRVLVIEDNSNGGDIRVRRYLKAKGYLCFLYDGLNDWYAARDDYELLTLNARTTQMRRRFRKRLYSLTMGILPVPAQVTMVKLKRRFLGKV